MITYFYILFRITFLMKKSWKILIVFITFIIIISQLLLAADVAYIVKNSNTIEQGYLKVFEELNLSVDIIEDKNIPVTNFSKYLFILTFYSQRLNQRLYSSFKLI